MLYGVDGWSETLHMQWWPGAIWRPGHAHNNAHRTSRGPTDSVLITYWNFSLNFQWRTLRGLHDQAVNDAPSCSSFQPFSSLRFEPPSGSTHWSVGFQGQTRWLVLSISGVCQGFLVFHRRRLVTMHQIPAPGHPKKSGKYTFREHALAGSQCLLWACPALAAKQTC